MNEDNDGNAKLNAGVKKLVNKNFERFNKEQQKHKSTYIGNIDNSRNLGDFNHSSYNSQEDTDKSVGATGRNTNG
jgi:hypothetical protein